MYSSENNVLDILLDNCEGLCKIKSVDDIGKLNFNMIEKTITFNSKIWFENGKWNKLFIKYSDMEDYKEIDLNEFNVFPDKLDVSGKAYVELIKIYLHRMFNSFGPNYKSNFISNADSMNYTESIPRNIAKIVVEYSVFFGILHNKIKWSDICNDNNHFFTKIENNIFYKSWFKSEEGEENAKINFRRS